VLEYLYKGQLCFEKQFVSLYSMGNIDSVDRMKNYIFSKEEIKIDEISDFAKTIHFRINSILMYLLSIDGILIKNADYVILEKLINFSERDIDVMETLIYEELKENTHYTAILRTALILTSVLSRALILILTPYNLIV
jgi:hypothetical protein